MAEKQVRQYTYSGAAWPLFRSRTTQKVIAVSIFSCFACFHFLWQSHKINLLLPSHHELFHSNGIAYPGEHVRWTPCGQLTNRTLECSTVAVPMDQFNTTNSSSKTFSIPLIRLRGHNATRNLLTNPGGPGGSGVDFLRAFGEQLNTIVGEGFHILSFDPRGVGGSLPVANCYPDDTTRRSHPLIHNGQRADDASEIYSWASNMAEACAETMGEHGKYINTPQTAADMNTILDAIGQKDMAYWGFSYGTLLGQTYASLFPKRSNRVIIDGVVNAFDWYEGVLNIHNLQDAENVFNGFFSECTKAGPRGCSLASPGKTAGELRADVLSFIADLRDQPQSVYINTTHYGMLSAEKVLFSSIFYSLYSPIDWPALADRLSRLLAGNGTDFFLAYGLTEPLAALGDSNSFVKMNDGLSGPTHWPQGRDALLKILRPYWNQSIFGQSQGRTYYLKQQWVLPRTHSFSPKRQSPSISNGERVGMKTAHPLLILSTTYDPVCPLQSARSANAAFEGSRIVELRGYGHCSLSMPSLCITRTVREFLYNGTLPDGHATCEVDAPYFPVVKDEDYKLLWAGEFEEGMDRRILDAQVVMARGRIWG